jgi:preprotein translocase subunit YajC
VKSALPLFIFLVVIFALILFSRRAKQKQAAVEAERTGRIGPGSTVMTTSGLYATVVARNADETVLLSIAPGVEVRWALAALRDLESLPPELRGQSGPDEGVGSV